MVGVTNKINYYCCRIFRGAPAPTAPMVLTPVINIHTDRTKHLTLLRIRAQGKNTEGKHKAGLGTKL